jgi:hypothetical protein
MVVLTQLLCVLERLRSQVLAPLESFDLYARPLVVVSIILAGFTLGIGALMNPDLNS